MTPEERAKAKQIIADYEAHSFPRDRISIEFAEDARDGWPQALLEIDRLEHLLAELAPTDLANLIDRLRYIAEQRGHFASCTPEHCECGLAITLHDAHAAIVALGGHHATQG